MMLLQGIVESIRCVICIRDGEWPQRLSDVEEMEKLILSMRGPKGRGRDVGPVYRSRQHRSLRP